ncbi:dTDP-4-dehydrorhamnose 3,5-epimerase [Prochlorococcus marinus str. MIT 1342]|uniref:dTDP-4-dehydrorhamnose 3,5-epimerase n=1 Tax=Prochlorococcus TaxID=1218 RepID=UPI0007B399FF|nr:dTDP-4-dehydrorhamnose 3,5-epimerase [Prochlorococcus marinus]KZR79903.1 dTDP-4-dehydrorhamnose 3,5-epimerase [Prochlorococcus marinus str. MIT 1342]
MQAEILNTANGIQLNGPLLLSPEVHRDERGFFFESWNQRRWEALLASYGQEASAFVQDNHSSSSRGVLRGLHYQLPPYPQGKLVRCVQGKIFDVAVDLRVASPTFGQWVAAHLSDENHKLLWLPVGFAHGFLTLSTHAEVLYKATGFWSRDCERAIRWDDPRLAITWPEIVGFPKLSNKDEVSQLFLEALTGEELFS